MNSLETSQNKTYRDLILLAILGAALLFPYLGNRDIWTSGEARVAQVAKQMRQTGDWIIPKIGDDTRMKKPPMAYWLVAAASIPFDSVDENGDKVIRVDEFVSRIPNALAGIGIMLIVYLMSLTLFNRQTAIYSSLALATTGVFWWQSRTTGIEIPQLFFNILALYAWLKYHKSENLKGGWIYLCYAALGFSLLEKGIGPLLILLIIVAYLVVARERYKFKISHHLLGLLIFCAVALPWPIAVMVMIKEKLHANQSVFEVWRNESAGRFQGFDHMKSPFYFLGKVLGDGQPWVFFAFLSPLFIPIKNLRRLARIAALTLMALLSLLSLSYISKYTESGLVHDVLILATGLIAGIAAAKLHKPLKRLCNFTAKSFAPNEKIHGLIFPATWVAVCFLFFSIPASKKSYYILPIYPAIAIMAGHTLSLIHLANVNKVIKSASTVFYKILAYILIAAGLITYPLANHLVSNVKKFKIYEGHAGHTIFVAIAILAFGALLLYLIRKEKFRAITHAIIVGSICMMIVHTSLMGDLNYNKSRKEVCEGLQSKLKPTDEICTYEINGRPIIMYYLNSHTDRLWNEYHLFAYAYRKQPTYTLMPRENYDELSRVYAIFNSTSRELAKLDEHNTRVLGRSYDKKLIIGTRTLNENIKDNVAVVRFNLKLSKKLSEEERAQKIKDEDERAERIMRETFGSSNATYSSLLHYLKAVGTVKNPKDAVWVRNVNVPDTPLAQ